MVNCKIVNNFFLSPNRLRFWLCLGNTCLARRQFLLLRQAANFIFFFDIAKVRKIQITSKLFLKKSTQKSTHTEMSDKSATVLQLLQLNLRLITPSIYTYIYIYINIYINIKVIFDLQVRDF
jgi:hypothetical protein